MVSEKGDDEDGRVGTETAMNLAKGKETFWCFGAKTLCSRGNSKLCTRCQGAQDTVWPGVFTRKAKVLES